MEESTVRSYNFFKRKENLMKRFLILILIFVMALTACDALSSPTQAPTAAPTSVPPTAEVVVVTVEVPVEVTAQPTEAPPTAVPTETQPPAPTEAAPTEAAPTAEPPTEAAPAQSTSSGGPVTVDASLSGGFFKDVTYSSPAFSLRCPPKEITISGTATDASITAVDFYYRIEDRKGTDISAWKNAGRMQPNGNGNFSITISGEDIHPDLRKALAWFDFQLVGLNKGGAAVGRTEKIVQKVTYTIDCP
jgi:hypothetical protein